jgi:hypothetical protein
MLMNECFRFPGNPELKKTPLMRFPGNCNVASPTFHRFAGNLFTAMRFTSQFPASSCPPRSVANPCGAMRASRQFPGRRAATMAPDRDEYGDRGGRERRGPWVSRRRRSAGWGPHRPQTGGR